MNSYQQEQWDALKLVRSLVLHLGAEQIDDLQRKIAPYLEFRQSVEAFLERYFQRTCTRSCYQSRRSACCSRDGIITFFADVLINVLYSETDQVEALAAAVRAPELPMKCIYLGPRGCLWQIRPTVCAMFLCEKAQKEVFDENPEARNIWKKMQAQERGFKWPDRPVLFDWLEQYALDLGYNSSLMYLHNSPGLLRVKQRAGLSCA